MGDFAFVKSLDKRSSTCIVERNRTEYFLKSNQQRSFMQLQRTLNEGAILKAISHPYIMRLHKSYLSHCENGIYSVLITELIDGEDIYEVLREFMFDHYQILYFSACLVNALVYLFQNFIVHGDLKLENIMLDRNGIIKIVDFGYAYLEDGCHIGSCGTLDYMAPELVNDQSQSYYSDIFALGIVISNISTLTSPFPYSQSLKERNENFYKRQDPEMDNEILWSLIDSMIKLNPLDRITYDGISKHTYFNDIAIEEVQKYRSPLVEVWGKKYTKEKAPFFHYRAEDYPKDFTIPENEEVAEQIMNDLEKEIEDFNKNLENGLEDSSIVDILSKGLELIIKVSMLLGKRCDIYKLPYSIASSCFMAERFENTKVIGRGASAIIFATRNVTCDFFTRKVVQIKDHELLQTVLSEYAIVRSLNHRDIIKHFYVYFYTNCRMLYASIFMESLPGVDLLRIIERATISESKLRHILGSLVSILEYLEARNIVHGDLQPANVIIMKRSVKLIDFGSACFGSGYQRGNRGSLDYLAPEVIGNKYYSPQSDMYSFGILAFLAVVREYPQNKSESLEERRKNVELTIPYDKIENQALKDLVQRLTHPERTSRFASFSEMKRHEYFFGYDFTQ